MTSNPEDVAQLIKALHDENWRARRTAAKALGKLGPQAKEAVPHLIDALKDENTSLRWAVVNALGAMGADAKEAIPTLQHVSHDWLSRQVALEALHKIDPERFSKP